MSVFNIFKAVSVRLCLLLHNILTVWRVTVNWNHDQLWLLLFANVPFIVEGAYTVTRRKGIEWKWICPFFIFYRFSTVFGIWLLERMCPCFLFFLLSTVPGIWLLEISSMNTYSNINSSAVHDIVISGISIPIRLSADTWNLVVEESLLYLMILGRWFLPRGEVSREQLSELLFAFIGIASDIMELFALFDEKQVRSNKVMTYALLAVWSWSILQFILIITVSHRPKRKRIQRILAEGQEKKDMVKFEIIGIFVSLFMQDIPFLVLRLYTMVTFNLVNYSLVFFSAKNVLVILLMWYRLVIICSNHYWRKKHRTKNKFEKNLPLDSIGFDNYINFDDDFDKTVYIGDNESCVNDEEKDNGRSNGTSKLMHLVDSEYGMEDSTAETSSAQLESNHKKDESSDRNISLENSNKEETDVKLPIDENSSEASLDRRTQSASSEGMGNRDSAKSYGVSVHTESDELSEDEDVTSSEFTSKDVSEQILDNIPKRHISIIQVHF